MLLKDIKPIDKFGDNFINCENSDEVIENIVEKPLQNACKIFRNKGIETVMSSANYNNVISDLECPKEKKDVCGPDTLFLEERPTFEDAGYGYAWIMINYDSLSSENKELLYAIEERIGPNGTAVGENTVWFLRSSAYCTFNDGPYIKEQDDLNMYDSILSKEFENRCIYLSYNDNYYPRRTVMLRMRVHENTTVEQVDNFFTTFADFFEDQKINKKVYQR